MYLQHFGLTHAPLGKAIPELWDDGALAPLTERFCWLLEAPGVGLLIGESGVGKIQRVIVAGRTNWDLPL